jgi:uncharacterized protein (UPF0276 family)
MKAERADKRIDLGSGIGWRPELALSIERRAGLGFIEVVAENISPESIPLPIERLRERGAQVIPHGVTLSLGGADLPDPRRLARLARISERLNTPFVSEHIAFVRAGGMESGHLLPLERSRESLDILVENVLAAKAALPVPLALENVAALFEWPAPEMDEAAFISEALERTDTMLLLDVSNLYANARNHAWDASDFLRRIPLERLAYVHIAGGVTRRGLYHDTHAHAIPEGALHLLEELSALAPLPGVMLERDDHFPGESELAAELDAIEDAINRGARRREQSYVRTCA